MSLGLYVDDFIFQKIPPPKPYLNVSYGKELRLIYGFILIDVVFCRPKDSEWSRGLVLHVLLGEKLERDYLSFR